MTCLALLTFTASLVAASASFYSQTVPGDNPVGYWRLDETSGNTAYDCATGHNGTNFDGITLGEPGGISDDPDTCYGYVGCCGFETGSSAAAFHS